MTQLELLKRVEAILADAAVTRTYGTIEIVLRDGRPSVLHVLKTERLEQGDNPRHETRHQR